MSHPQARTARSQATPQSSSPVAEHPSTAAPIGVFDSGMGGLTVLAALEAHLPTASFVYLGDTARLPYGTKSPATVERYALRAAAALVERGVCALVVACNTASAVALDALRARYPELPVFGVVEPGAQAVSELAGARRVAVLATESTVRGGAYQRALLSRRGEFEIRARPCPLLVTLAEEGWLQGEVPDVVLRGYLTDWLSWRPDCLLLGCTHFPIFRAGLQALCGPEVVIVDSAATTAVAVAQALGPRLAGATRAPRVLLATDDPIRFARVGQHFIGGAGEPLGDVDLVELV